MTTFRSRRQSSLVHRVALGLAMGTALFFFSSLLETLLNDGSVSGINGYADNVLMGLIAGGLVFWYEQRRHRVLLDKIRVIADMNHHVRNALQAITWAPYVEHSSQIQIINQAAQRIQWALREILPGEVDTVEARSATRGLKPASRRAPAK